VEKISVIIPVKDRLSLLKEAIYSVIYQTIKPHEIVVVDDDSTEMIEEVACIFGGNIKYLRINKSGVSRARNAGIDVSKGELIAFLDSDDLWLPEKLKIQQEFMEQNPDYMWCYTDEIWVRNGRRVNPPRRYKRHSGYVFKEALDCCFIGCSTVMMRRSLLELIGPFDEDLPVCEDYEMWLRILMKYPVAFINRPLVIKRSMGQGQLSVNYTHKDRFRTVALLKLLIENEMKRQHYLFAVRKLFEMDRCLMR
jgi:GT2 family glycosyltransferase